MTLSVVRGKRAELTPRSRTELRPTVEHLLRHDQPLFPVYLRKQLLGPGEVLSVRPPPVVLLLKVAQEVLRPDVPALRPMFWMELSMNIVPDSTADIGSESQFPGRHQWGR